MTNGWHQRSRLRQAKTHLSTLLRRRDPDPRFLPLVWGRVPPELAYQPDDDAELSEDQDSDPVGGPEGREVPGVLVRFDGFVGFVGVAGLVWR